MSDMEINEKDRMHQLLCAYVLGEAEESERAEVETALANDAALREERDRIASTIGLVKGALGKDEILSWRATSEVTRAAAQRAAGPVPAVRPVAWYRATPLRAAAGFVALVGASYLGWQAFVVNERTDSLIMAKAERPADAPRGALEDRRDEGKLTGLGYLSSVPPASKGVDRVEKNGLPASEVVDSEHDALREGSDEKKMKEAAQVQEQLRKAGEESLAARAAGLKSQVGALDGSTAVPATNPAPAPDPSRFAGGYNPNLIQGSQVTPSAKPGATGQDEYFIGKVEGQPAPAEAPPALAAQPVGATGGTAVAAGQGPAHFSGAAPARPGAGGGGPSSPGPAGPATPGISSPGQASAGGEAKQRPAELPDEHGISRLRLLADNVESNAGTPSSAAAQPLGYEEAKRIEELLEQQVPLQGQNQPAGETEFERVDRFKQDKDSGDDASRRQVYLSPEERQARVEQIILSCRPLPNETPRDMYFRFWGDNPFEWTANDRQSTFSMDVDTASYTLARRYLVESHLPEKAQIRTEEFVNYFKPDVAPPRGKDVFTIATEMAPSRYSDPRDNKWMLRVAVRGMEVQKSERQPLTLTFVIDVSGSMKENNRLELVKHALRQLVAQLDARDSIALVAFSSDTRLILPMTSAAQRSLIESAINPLQPDGSTNTEAGLRMGYDQAVAGLTKNATNRVVLLTDGVANVGITDPNVLVQTVERQRKAGIYLNTIGVGMNNHNDNLLEQLADKGDGLCNYVDDAAEVKHALVDNFTQALIPIARDAKVQVEFDPAQVERYRLLGYENRAIADQDFRNDKVDAGEINSGHQITALYEIVRTLGSASDAPLASVHVRYKPPYKDGLAQPSTEEASEISAPVFAKNAAASFDATPFGYRRAVIAAQFAEFLRRSVHARGDSLDMLIADAQKLAGENRDPEVAELSDMVVKSKALLDSALQPRGPFEERVYTLRERCYERERLVMLHRDIDRERLRVLDQEVASIENELRTMFGNRVR